VYNPHWNPYYDGHWVYTDMGWAWVSDYEWGSIPYHYGTWVADPRAGWVWIPGNVWAPSWVVFRTGPDYIGWAPVPPGFSVGMSIDFGPSSFVFVSSHDFLAPRLSTLVIPRDRVGVIVNNTTVVNNIVIQNNVVINRGPDVTVVERATGRSIRKERIESVARVAPFEHVSRAQLEVTPERVKHGVRVDDPVPASRALPTADKHQGDKHGKPPASTQKKTNDQAPDAQKSHNDAVTPSSTEQKTNTNPQKKTHEQATAEAQKTHKDETAPHQKATTDTTKAKQSDQKDAQAKAKAKADAEERAKKEQDAKDKDDSGKGTTEHPKDEK
jgi:hypothetical protein